MDYTGTGQLAQRPQPAHPAADHGLAAVLGHRDARRRVPVRPRVHAGPRVLRRRPAVGVLRPRPAGPGDQPGQADRRAVGRRPGRLPGRQLPAAVDASGTASTATPCATSGAASPARSASSPPGSTGSSRPLPGRRPPPVRVDQLRHRARRLHAARPRLATTRSTTRPTARAATTARATTARGTAGSRAPPTTRRCSTLRARQQRNFITTLFLSQGVPMLLHGDEMGRTQNGNNNVYCQDNAIVLDGLVAARRRTPGWSASPRGSSALRRRAPGVPPAPVLRRASRSRRSRGTSGRRPCRTSPGSPRRRGDDRAGLGLRLRQVRHGVPQRQGHHRGRPRAASAVTDDSFLLCLNAHYEDIEVTLPPPEYGDAAGRSSSTPRSARCSRCHRPAWWRPTRAVRAGRRPVPARSASSCSGRTSAPAWRSSTVRAAASRSLPRATCASARSRPRPTASSSPPDDDVAAGRRARALPRRARGRRAVRLAAARSPAPGRNHGYDVVDPTRVCGAARRRGRAARARRGAPRHAAWASCSTSCPTTSASTAPRRTRGGGTCSRTAGRRAYASYFDIDWDAGPIAAGPGAGDARRGEGARRAVRSSDDGTELRYYEHAFPVAPGTGGRASRAGGARAPALPARRPGSAARRS